jgi:hypothetical protein
MLRENAVCIKTAASGQQNSTEERLESPLFMMFKTLIDHN